MQRQTYLNHLLNYKQRRKISRLGIHQLIETDIRSADQVKDLDSTQDAKAKSTLSQAGNTTQSSAPGWLDADQIVSLKDSIDIVAVIESFGLDRFERRPGNRATSLCPFHDDTNPSLSVDGARKIFKCFSCGVGGDVFQFVRKYSQIQTGEELSYFHAVNKVAAEFGDGSIAISGGSLGSSRMSVEERERLQRKRERTFLANGAAALFYANCLTEPFAGGARAYMSTRHLSPATARSVMLGYAPDAYYGYSVRSKRKNWGDESLVEHLKDLGFTPQEILDAGLAVQTKQKISKSIRQDNNTIADDGSVTDESSPIEYASLMDRFRHRLMVPIFDKSGDKVLGFGGRILPSVGESIFFNNEYQPPKYINSPESVVFQKKDVLFGLHKARESISQSTIGSPDANIILVEGYIDTIALWATGVQSVVATMGTAVSKEQLFLAAQAAEKGGGRIVICLDNDDAGIAAVERICTNGMLRDACARYAVEFVVATLPEGCKDPDQFIEECLAPNEDGAALFQKDVITPAVEWTEFYVRRILASHDASASGSRAGSFGNIFDRLAEFIGGTLGAADRTRTASEVAALLAEMMRNETTDTSASSTIRSQLESDLIDKVARVADAKEVLERRAQSSSSYSNVDVKTVLSTIRRGGISAIEEDENKLSLEARREARNNSDDSSIQMFRDDDGNTRTMQREDFSRTQSKGQASAVPKKWRNVIAKNLTPHFFGFGFEKKSDAYWLGLKETKKLLRGTSVKSGNLLVEPTNPKFGPFSEISSSDPSEIPGRFNLGKPVYFNSNDYHGLRFLTSSAAEAGYIPNLVDCDLSVISNGLGVGVLLQSDHVKLQALAEDELLKVLVLHSSTRGALKNALAARSAVGSPSELEWSSSEKEWLYSRLVLNADRPPNAASPEGLRSYLTELPDCPVKAFSHIAFSNDGNTLNGSLTMTSEICAASSSNFKGVGTLDRFFDVKVNNEIQSTTLLLIEDDARCERLVQNLFVTLLCASSMVRANNLRTKIERVSAEVYRINSKSESTAERVYSARDRLMSNQQPTVVSLPTLTNGEVKVHPQVVFGIKADNEVNGRVKKLVLHDNSGFGNEDAAFHMGGGWDDDETSMAANYDPRELDGSMSVDAEEMSIGTTFDNWTPGTIDAQAYAINDDERSDAEKSSLSDNTAISPEHTELELELSHLTSNLRNTMSLLSSLADSSKRITSRLMDEASSEVADGRMSRSLQSRLADELDGYLSNYREPQWLAEYTIDDGENKESRGVALASIDREWGPWTDDEFYWSPHDSTRKSFGFRSREDLAHSVTDDSNADQYVESYEDFNDRVEGEWNDFL
jgi:DNA primase catalytic core